MLTLHCPPKQVFALAELLRARGAETVAVAELGYVFTRDNPLYARLAEAL
jgi:ATP phosphoribosyltransferase